MDHTGANWAQRFHEVGMLEAAYLGRGEMEGGEYCSYSAHMQVLVSRLDSAVVESD